MILREIAIAGNRDATMTTDELPEWFAKRTTPGQPADATDVTGHCLEWTGAKHPAGYGNVYNREDRRTWLAHRMAYTLAVGAIPAGLTIDHRCHNLLCVNPAHLQVVARGENTRRAQTRRSVNRSKTHCKRGHELNEVNAYVLNGQRRCRACRRLRHHAVKAGRIVNRTARERFDSKWKADGQTGCWLWTGTKDCSGYGMVTVAGHNRRAHRLGYELYVGEIPEGLTIDHVCSNRACVNPDHLETVTRAENTRRAVAANRRTHCKKGHEFTPENTFMDSGKRRCAICTRARDRERYAKDGEKRRALARLQGKRYYAQHREQVLARQLERRIAENENRPARVPASHCKRGHEFTPENTIHRSDGGGRRCRECRTTYNSAYAAARKPRK